MGSGVSQFVVSEQNKILQCIENEKKYETEMKARIEMKAEVEELIEINVDTLYFIHYCFI